MTSMAPSSFFGKRLTIAMLLVSFLGFLDAMYLTAKHYSGSAFNCTILTGCDQVTTSSYATIFGVPVALLGAAYYLFVFILCAFYIDSKRQKVLSFVSIFTTAGFVASLYFVYLQAFVIRALCQYCIVSAVTSTTLFVLGMTVLHHMRKISALPS